MKLPPQLIWGVIGDAFERAFDVDSKRQVELLWQSMNELSGQGLDYVHSLKRATSVFDVDPLAPYGTFYTMPTLLERSSTQSGLLLGQRNGRWLFLLPDNTTVPMTGFFGLFGSSIPYSRMWNTQLMSDFSLAEMQTRYYDQPWDPRSNPSFVFNQNTSLDGSERWSDEGTPALIPQDDGLLFSPTDSNWSILQDQCWFSGDQNWEQIWRVRVDSWEPSPDHDRSISVFSFGDTGPNYEVRIRDSGSQLEVGSGMVAKIKYSNLNFSGSVISQVGKSFWTQGFRPGMTIDIVGSDFNDGSYLVDTVTTGNITVVNHTFTTESAATASVGAGLVSMTGTTVGWRDRLLAATGANPVYIEIVMSYRAATSEMSAKVLLGDESVEGASVLQLPSGRRHQDFSVFNQVGDVQVVLEWVAAPKGRLWNSPEDLDFNVPIGASYGFVYVVPEELRQSARIQWGPYDLASDATIEEQTSTMLKLEIPEEYVKYAPEYARILGPEGDVVARLVGEVDENSIATYEKISSSTPGIEFRGNIRLHPWYLDPGEFEWIARSTFTTKIPIPFERRRCFFIRAEGQEVGLYERFGILLGLPRREDSQEYLDSLRGMEYGLRTRPTPYHISQAVSIILGSPYSPTPGFISNVQRTVGALGNPLYDVVYINGQPVRIDHRWFDSGALLPVGSYVSKMETLVRSVVVNDWLSDPDLVRSRVGPWKQWSTFIVQIPTSLGLNLIKAGDLRELMDRRKDVHTDYLLELIDDTHENHFSDNILSLESADYVGIAHTIEDLIADDAGEVVGNPLDFFQSGGVSYSEEWQAEAEFPLRLDSGHALDAVNPLDRPNASKFDLIKIEPGISFDMPEPEYFRRNAAINLNREMEALETDRSRRSLRMTSPNTADPFGHRPYSLCFPMTGASPKWSVQNGGGVLAGYHTQSWNHAHPSNNQDLHGVHMATPALAWAVGDNGAIWETANYGETWSNKTVSTALSFRACDGNWAVGDSGLAYRRSVGGSWSVGTIGSSSYNFVSIQFIGPMGWVLAENSGATYLFRTGNGGDSWSPAQQIDASNPPINIDMYDEDRGALMTDGSLATTIDGGLTWDVQPNFSGSKFMAMPGQAKFLFESLNVVGMGGAPMVMLELVEGVPVIQPISWDVAFPVGAQLMDISFANEYRGCVVGTNGVAYDTADGGHSWTARTIPNEDWHAVDYISPWYRMAVGPNAGTYDVVRWK